ncbi:uncharacterized protein LOC144355824, partial [Saccoglossus kowalevskii]
FGLMSFKRVYQIFLLLMILSYRTLLFSDHLGECPRIGNDDQICVPCISDRNCGTSEKCCDDCCKVAVTKPYGCLMSDGSVWPDGAYRIIDCVLCQCRGTAFRCIVQIC